MKGNVIWASLMKVTLRIPLRDADHLVQIKMQNTAWHEQLRQSEFTTALFASRTALSETLASQTTHNCWLFVTYHDQLASQRIE